MTNVVALTKPKITIETDEGLIRLMKRAQDHVFEGNVHEFEKAYAEALVQQVLELTHVNIVFTVDLAEVLADAMRGVLLQWLDEYTCCPREDLPVFLALIARR